jgi:hypothetical protein
MHSRRGGDPWSSRPDSSSGLEIVSVSAQAALSPLSSPEHGSLVDAVLVGVAAMTMRLFVITVTRFSLAG